MVKNAKTSDVRVLFGRKLSALRKLRGWSQEQLALESGLARSYLGGVERGQRNIALINICRLAETLDLPPSELLNFADPG
jgi:transcriptional regulator with XRE-family HTH domain